MPQRGTNQSWADGSDAQPLTPCDACNAAIESPGRDTVSFLRLDQLTIPLVGCDDHLEQFSSVCGLTSESEHTLLHHLPAGGVPCPSCRQAHRKMEHPLVPVDGGALAILACSRHQSAILDRYETGRQTQRHLATSLGGR